MGLKCLTPYLSLSVMVLTTTFFSKEPAYSQPTTFSCGISGGVPATIVHSPRHGNVPIIKWVSYYFMDSGYDPQTRCNQVSARFQEYSDRGQLNYLTTGILNREPIICATEAKNQPCNLLFTIKKISSPTETLQRLIDIRYGARTTALEETNDRVFINFDALVEEKAQQVSNTTQPLPKPIPESITNPSSKPTSNSNPNSLF